MDNLVAVQAEPPPFTAAVDQPAPQPRGYGLYSVATVLTPGDEGAGGRWSLGAQYPTGDAYRQQWAIWPGGLDCAPQLANRDNPLGDTTTPPEEGGDFGTANAFMVNAGVECWGGGRDDELAARARAILDWNEQFAVERALWTGEGGNNQYLAGTWAADLTPAGGPVDPVDGVALLERHIATGHARGIIHAPPGIAAYLSGVVRRDGNRQVTSVLENAVAFGAGYAGGIGPAGAGGPGATDDWDWMFASGQVVIRRGPIRVLDPIYGPRDDTALALAERTVQITIDGAVAAVRVARTTTV